jgi:trk system potassium uptake protein TrkH
MDKLRQYLSAGSIYGRLITLVGLLLLGPLVVLPANLEELNYAPAFLVPGASCIVVGMAISIITYRRLNKDFEYQVPVQRGSLPVMFVWLFSFVVGAIPFLYTGQLNFVQALFESVSGWTTTGLTLLQVHHMPHIFLFYRSYIQFFGGIGFMLVLSMFVRNRQTTTLYSAEGHTERVIPNVRRAARLIFTIYSALLALGTILYWLSGETLFDAFCQTMSAVSTSGFSTEVEGFTTYGNFAVEAITVTLMLIGASNFATLLVLTDGKLTKLFRSTELRFMLVLMACFVPVIAGSLFFQLGLDFWTSLRQSVFCVVSVFSTTGFSIGAPYTSWPPFAVGLIMILMVIGGSSGSTSGGIKLIRTYFILRITRDSVLRQLSSAIRTDSPSYHSVRERVPIDRALISDTFGFVSCYLGILIIGTLLMTITTGCTLFQGMFEFLSVFGTSGMSIGLTNINTNSATLIVEILGMFLGRMEIFVVFFGVSSFVKTLRNAFQRKLPRINPDPDLDTFH